MKRAVVLLSLVAGSALASAQDNTRTGGIVGVWSDTTKWSLGYAPTAGQTAVISDGSIGIDEVDTPSLWMTEVGKHAATSGTLILSDGLGKALDTTNIRLATFGDGDMDMGYSNAITTNDFRMALAPGADASFVMPGGDLDVTDFFFIGENGYAEFILSGGTVDAGGLTVARFAGSVGIVDQTGGTVTTTSLTTDGEGTGTYSISAGSIDTTYLYCGMGFNAATGELNVSGSAEVNPGQLQLGNSAVGTVNQSGGVVTVGTLHMALAASGTANYNLSGGVLDAWLVDPGDGTKNFSMTGGTLIVDTWGQSAQPYDLDPTGGLVLPYGKLIGPMTVYGTFDLGSLASIRYQLDTPGASDIVYVNGRVKLQGSLITVVVNPPSPGDEFTLIVNDSTDPVIGQFSGLAEGDPYSVSVGGTTYDFTISYTGGNGNDVVLTATSCPPDLNSDGVLDNGDLGLFITFFLAGDLAADFTNDGFLDNGDINAFIVAFLAGC